MDRQQGRKATAVHRRSECIHVRQDALPDCDHAACMPGCKRTRCNGAAAHLHVVAARRELGPAAAKCHAAHRPILHDRILVGHALLRVLEAGDRIESNGPLS
jgi:hypothetical protein